MGNIGGRSKGCSTCRKRRVKCDEGRPICMRCRRWNFDCDGPRGAVFIQANTVASLEAPATQKSSTTIYTTDRPDFQPVLRSALSVIGFDVYICYTRENLQKGGFIVSAIADIKALDVLPAENTLANGLVSHQAILSLATMLFGMQHRQADIARRGYALYSVALTQLNQALATATQHIGDETIIAVAALSVTECLVPSGKKNYLKHMVGLQKLLGLREPSTFWPRQSYGFRNGVRFMVLLSSLELSTPCILAKSEWKKAMRIDCSAEELREQELWEVIADCTLLNVKSKKILSAWDVDVARAKQWLREVEDQGQTLLAQLCAWKRALGHRQSGFSTETAGISPPLESRSDPTASDPTSPTLTATQMSSPSRAADLVLFDVTLACLLQILASLPCQGFPEQNVFPHATSARNTSMTPKEHYAAQERLATLGACRRVHSFLESGGVLDASVPPVLHWAQAMAWKNLRYDKSAEGDWLRKLVTAKLESSLPMDFGHMTTG